MRKRSSLVLLIGLGIGAAIWWPRPIVFARSYEGVMGTSLDLKVVASSSEAATQAESAILAEIDRESRILSGYDATSEFRRWTATLDEPVIVSAELFDVLHRFDQWRARTSGAIDASAETVSRVWKAAEAAGHLPSAADRAAAAATARQTHWRLDAATRTATHLDRAPLVLNSFAKSYIIDHAAERGLATPGVRALVVDAGGDLVMRGDWSWPVDIADPRSAADNARPLMSMTVRDRAVATSGNYRRGFDIQGVHYSHIVDPRTGEPARQAISATVVAANGADAGALATALCVLTPDESEQLAATVPGSEFMLVLADGRHIESAGWVNLAQPVAAQAVWKPDFELTISLEIAQPAFRAQRPYIAVWIEDKDRKPVRTIAVWYSERQSRYLPELRAWFRSDQDRLANNGTDVLRTVASATRGPGQYSLVWDGKDNLDKPVKAGTYTVLIEAAREHGTYQIMRQDMDFSGVAKKIDLPPNVEVAAATLDYHRVK